MNARAYHDRKRALSDTVRGSLDRLRAAYDVVVIEGAGSPAEINLRSRDIVNMHVARMADAPVLLVGDIDRGGVFAHFVGTLELLEPEERALVAGLVINKFRGDPRLLESGVRMIEERTNLPMLGVVPFVRDLRIADEDSVSLDHRRSVDRDGDAEVDIAVVRLPRISNFDDFLALEHEPGVVVRYVDTPHQLEDADLVVLPGTKDTRSDLQWLRSRHLDKAVRERAQRGQPVLGICGGYQMLGTRIDDPLGVEGPASSLDGLDLLPVRTIYRSDKTTVRVRARQLPVDAGLLSRASAEPVVGYEIHMGEVELLHDAPALFEHEDGRREGTARGAVSGTLLHGLFENDALRTALLDRLASENGRSTRPRAPRARLASAQAEYDRLADALEASLDLARVARILGPVGTPLLSATDPAVELAP